MPDMSQEDLRQTGHENLKKSAGWRRISWEWPRSGNASAKYLSGVDIGGLLLVSSHLVQALQMNRVSTMEHADSFRRLE